MAATAKTGRDVRIYALFMVIAAETDEEAMEKWISYREGVDEEAIAWLGRAGRGRQDHRPPPTSASSPTARAR